MAYCTSPRQGWQQSVWFSLRDKPNRTDNIGSVLRPDRLLVELYFHKDAARWYICGDGRYTRARPSICRLKEAEGSPSLYVYPQVWQHQLSSASLDWDPSSKQYSLSKIVLFFLCLFGCCSPIDGALLVLHMKGPRNCPWLWVGTHSLSSLTSRHRSLSNSSVESPEQMPHLGL